MHGVGQSVDVLDGGQRRAKRRGGFGVMFSISAIGFPIGSPTEKSFRFLCKNLIRFPFGKYVK